MTRQPWQDIRIRETPEGPEIVFDGGVSGWVIPATEADLATLERRITLMKVRPGADPYSPAPCA